MLIVRLESRNILIFVCNTCIVIYINIDYVFAKGREGREGRALEK